MKVITEWKDLGISSVGGHALQIITTISSVNEEEIEELKQSLGATFTVIEGERNNDD